MKVDHKETVIYSNQKTEFRTGYRYSNARLFDGKVRAGVTRVIVVGDWPLVEKAYRKAGVEVIKCDAAGNILEGGMVGDVAAVAVESARQAPHVRPEAPATSQVDKGTIQIPGNWQTLSWNERRKIAAQFAETHIINGEQAETVIKAELARRAANPPAKPKNTAPSVSSVTTVEAEKAAAPKPTAPKPAPVRVAPPAVFTDAFLAKETKVAAATTALKVEPSK